MFLRSLRLKIDDPEPELPDDDDDDELDDDDEFDKEPLPPIQMLAVVGGLTPMVWSLSRLTCITTKSISTSGLGLSISSSNFLARIIWSEVPRNVNDLCSGEIWIRLISRIPFRVPAASCSSVAVAALRR